MNMRRIFASKKANPQGFTLTELLVCIAIIVVLVGISLPVVSGLRENANRTKCLSNIRQIGVAFNEYAAENNHFGPYDARDAGNDSPSLLRAGQSLILFGQLLPYVIPDTAKYLASTSQTPEVFLCPSTESKMLAAYRVPVGPGGLQYTRYFMNTDVSTNPSKKTSLTAMPGSTIIIMDDCYWWTNAPGNDENHKGVGFNCFRLDGSAGWMKKTDTLNSPAWNFTALSQKPH